MFRTTHCSMRKKLEIRVFVTSNIAIFSFHISGDVTDMCCNGYAHNSGLKYGHLIDLHALSYRQNSEIAVELVAFFQA